MNLLLALAASLVLASGASAQCISYGTPSTMSIPGLAFGTCLADLNNDGKLDLITNGTSGISISLGNGNGTFATPAFSQLGATMAYLAIGDLNRDGKLDLVVSDSASGLFFVIRGDGNGGLVAPATTYPTSGGAPGQVALGDFNGDGRLDVAIACQTGNNVQIRLNSASGTLGSALTLSTGGSINGVAAADFNGDGKLDLAVSRANTGTTNNGVMIFRGNGNGTFQTSTNTGAGGGTWMQIADVNGDAHPDLIVSNNTDRAVHVQLGRADGTFQPVITTPATGMTGSPWGCALADLSGDGILDLAIPLGDSGKLGIRLGNGDGTFAAQTDITCATKVNSTVMGDLNSNGKIDLITGNYPLSTASIIMNHTTYAARITSQPVSVNPSVGQSVSFAVQAVNTTSYQWYRNGLLLTDGGHFSGATTPTLNIMNLTPFEGGSFYCSITNSCNTANSNVVTAQNSSDCQADFNHDSSIDFFDYLDFVDAYSAGC